MELAKNQKGFKELSIDDALWNTIKDDNNKVLVAFGSNGKGKSTIKDLFQNDNLAKNFEHENDSQSNCLYTEFGGNKYLVFDEKFVEQFVYSNDSLQQNQMKVIMKTDRINELFEQKSHANDVVNNILNVVNKYLSTIDSFDGILNIKSSSSGNVTAAKKRFATTFIKGTLPHKYDELFSIADDGHRKWWYEGLLLYKENHLDYCPWCKNDFNTINEDIKSQVCAVEDTTRIDGKLFSDKVEKTTNLASIMNNTLINEEIKDDLNRLISEINISVDQDIAESIINNINSLSDLLKHDKEIFENIKQKVKILDNILEVKNIDLDNSITKLKFFKITDEINELSDNVDYFINYKQDLINGIKDSNQTLYDLIKNSEMDINDIIKSLGLKYYLEIESDQIVSAGINDNEKYITLKSLNGNDISQKIGSTLSFGEKSTLAFAIFIEQIRNFSDENTIIIFDDPISSYDIFRRYTSLGIIQTIINLDFKKIVILTHESNFLTSIVANYERQASVQCVILNEINESEIKIESLNQIYNSEVHVYKDMLNFSNNFHLSQRVIALRQLHDLFNYITGEKKDDLYNYLCKLVHFRKNDSATWNMDVADQIKEVFDYFGVQYDTQIESIQDEQQVFNDMEALLTDITNKSVYSISLEDLISLRMISEVAVRNESSSSNRYTVNTLWRITDSIKERDLKKFRVLLNSITHVDNDEIAWPVLCVNDLKSIPKYVIAQIIDVLK